MCLAIPYKIESINSKQAIVKDGSKSLKIDIHLVESLKKGDWVLVSQNLAVSKITPKDALKTLKLLKETLNSKKS